ncbi:hypothetical protein [Kitasatospora aureofaciens]|uniref:hypothetical protein n=1 Tax=Kitasatospora aureofaciens TaxID=1894 RepID=UPI0037C87FEE
MRAVLLALADAGVPLGPLLGRGDQFFASTQLRSEPAQSALTAAFIKNTLSRPRSTPTLVLAHAQDIRKRWP